MYYYDDEKYEEVLNRMINLGNRIDEFFNSNIGKYVVQKVKDAVNSNLFELRAVNPEDTEKIRSLQFNIAVAETAIGWLNEKLLEIRDELERMDQESDDN